MKKRVIALSLALTIVFAMMGTSTYAQDLPGAGWWTFSSFQNISSDPGTMTMEAYPKEGDGGSAIGSQSFSVASGAALAYHPGLDATYPSGDRIEFNQDLPANFEGSIVMSADKEMAAVAQLGNNQSGSVGLASGTASSFYQGIGSSNAGQTVNFPLAKHNFAGQTTTFYIQAAGGDANVTVTWKMNNGQQYTETKNVTQSRMWAFSAAAAGVPGDNCGAAATSGCLGAASAVSTSGAIVGVVVEHPHSASPAPFALSTRGLTASDQGLKLIAPIIKNDFYGSTTGFSVQNVSTEEATVSIALKVTNAEDTSLIGNEYTDSETVPAGGAVVFRVSRNNLGGMPAGTFASATVTSNKDVVGAVNEAKNQGGTPGGQAKAVYYGFSSDGANSAVSAELSAPLVKENFFGKTTGLVVANAGDSSTKFQATYVDADGTTRTFETSSDVAPGAAVSFYQVFKNTGNKFTGTNGFSDFAGLEGTKNAVVITSSNGQKIVAVAQEADVQDGQLDIKNYEGFNK